MYNNAFYAEGTFKKKNRKKKVFNGNWLWNDPDVRNNIQDFLKQLL